MIDCKTEMLAQFQKMMEAGGAKVRLVQSAAELTNNTITGVTHTFSPRGNSEVLEMYELQHTYILLTCL